MTPTVSKIDSAKIHFNAVRLLESQFSTSDDFLKKQVLPERIDAQIRQESRVNLDSNFYGIRLEIILRAIDVQGIETGLNARYLIQFGFTIDNLNELVQIEESGITINPRLSTTLVALSYSTARGIILERTQGSFFNGAILPVINPSDIINGPDSESYPK